MKIRSLKGILPTILAMLFIIYLIWSLDYRFMHQPLDFNAHDTYLGVKIGGEHPYNLIFLCIVPPVLLIIAAVKRFRVKSINLLLIFGLTIAHVRLLQFVSIGYMQIRCTGCKPGQPKPLAFTVASKLYSFFGMYSEIIDALLVLLLIILTIITARKWTQQKRDTA